MVHKLFFLSIEYFVEPIHQILNFDFLRYFKIIYVISPPNLSITVSIHFKFLFYGLSGFSVNARSLVCDWLILLHSYLFPCVIIFILYSEFLFVKGYILGCGRVATSEKVS